MQQPATLPTRDQIAAHLERLRAAVGGERSPLGRAWNHDMQRRERLFWARAAGLGPTDSRRVACLDWQMVEPKAQTAIRCALARAADRAKLLLSEGKADA